MIDCFSYVTVVGGLWIASGATAWVADSTFLRSSAAGSAGAMDLELFFTALEEMANQLFPLELSKFDALVDVIIENLNDLKPNSGLTSKTGTKSVKKQSGVVSREERKEDAREREASPRKREREGEGKEG